MKTENKPTPFPEGLFKNYFGNDRIADFSTSKFVEQGIPVVTEQTKKNKLVSCGPGKKCS